MAQVVLENLTKIYPGGVRAVDAINLSIADSEFVVLVGPSGCGKTTTLRMIAGLEDITSGTIRLGDRIVNNEPPQRRDVAMVFQNYALYPHLSVYENMAFGLRTRKTSKTEIRQRVMETAKVLDIQHLLDRKPRQLSGGQRQRVAVGRAIVRKPAAFLFDEPLSNLDAHLRASTRAELKRLHQRLATTTIHVTHDQEEAMTLGDRIVVMKDGIIQQADSPLATYNEPVNRFVAGFIGLPPMNFFDGLIMMQGAELLFAESRIPSNGVNVPPEGFVFPVPARLVERLKPHIGRPLVMGIRPEHLSLEPFGLPAAGAAAAGLQLKVNVVEPLGNDMDIYMRTNLNDHVVARIEAGCWTGSNGGLRTDSAVTMYVDARKVHFFEPGETGMNLSRNIEPDHAVA
jgi:multiple sugar transport system ATP-binding protein